MAVASVLCIFIGCYTPYLYQMLPYPEVKYHPYTSYHVSETLQILLFTGLGFFLLIRKLKPEATISLDLDWFYRMGGRAFLWLAEKAGPGGRHGRRRNLPAGRPGAADDHGARAAACSTTA